MKTKIKIRNRITHMWLSVWIHCTVTLKKNQLGNLTIDVVSMLCLILQFYK